MRWFVILVCLGIPCLVVWTGSDLPSSRAIPDIRFPATCEAAYRQAQSDREAATKSATELLNSAASTGEERECAGKVLELIRIADGAEAPPLDLSLQACTLVVALQDNEAPSAAASALLAVAERPAPDDGCPGVPRDVGTAIDPALPVCNAVARRLVDGPVEPAQEAIKAGLESSETAQADSTCLYRVNRAIAAMAPAGSDPPELGTLPLHEECEKAALLYDQASDAVDPTASGTAPVEDKTLQARQILEDARENGTRPLCAVGGLARLQDQPTFAEWTFEQANRVVAALTQWIEPHGLTLADGSETIVVTLVWLFTVGLLVVALRQYIRWRRERIAGPVAIDKIETPKDDAASTALTEIMRDSLAQAGVFPTQRFAGVGEVVIDVTEVAGAFGDTGRIGKIFEAIKGAIAVTSGYTLSAVAHPGTDATSEKCCITVQLQSASTKRAVMVDSYGAATYAQATKEAAFQVYLWLADQPEVRRRIPAYLRWTSPEGLQLYHEGLEAKEDLLLRRADEKLLKAATYEPSNVFIQLAISSVNQQLAIGSPREKSLRSDNNERQQYYMRALRAAARAVALNPKSAEARGVLALLLGYVDEWRGGWSLDPQLANEVADLLDEIRRRRDAPSSELPTDRDLFNRHFLVLSERQYCRAYRYLRWHRVLWTSLALDRRRAVADYLWPFRRARATAQAMTVTALTGTRYLLMASGADERGRPLRSWLQVWRVRAGYVHGLGRLPNREGSVRYNVAAALANKATWLRTRSIGASYVEVRAAQRVVEARVFRLVLARLFRQRLLPGIEGWDDSVGLPTSAVARTAADARIAKLRRGVASHTASDADRAADLAKRKAARSAARALEARVIAVAIERHARNPVLGVLDEEVNRQVDRAWRVANEARTDASTAAVEASKAANDAECAGLRLLALAERHAKSKVLAAEAVDDAALAAAAAATTAALRMLKLAYEITTSQVSVRDLEFVDTDPDFRLVRDDDRYRGWIAEFKTYDILGDLLGHWHETFRVVASKAEAARGVWIDQALTSRPYLGRRSPEASEWFAQVTGWLSDDLRRWRALGAWGSNAASDSRRDAFEDATKVPRFNGGEPMSPLAAPKLPVPDTSEDHRIDPTLPPMTFLKLWEQNVGYGALGTSACEVWITALTDAIEIRDVERAVWLVDRWSVATKQAWLSLRRWSLDPADVDLATDLRLCLLGMATVPMRLPAPV